MRRQGLGRPRGPIRRKAESLRQMLFQEIDQRRRRIPQAGARRHRLTHRPHRLRQRHEHPTLLLRQRAQVMLHLRPQVARYRPVQRGLRQRRDVPHVHFHLHAVILLTRAIGVLQRQDAVLEGERRRKRRLIRRRYIRVTQIIRPHEQEPGIRTAPAADEVDQLRDRRDSTAKVLRRLRILLWEQALRVEAVQRFIQVQVTAIAGPREQALHLSPHLPVVGEEVERPRDRVTDQSLPDEDLRRRHRIHGAEAHRARLQFQAIKPGAALDHHLARLGVPERFAVAAPQQVRPKIEDPGRIHACAGAGEEARGLNDLRGHDPAGHLWCTLRRGAALAFDHPALGLLAPEEHGSGKQRHPPVMRRLEDPVLLIVRRQVAEQAGQDAAVDRPKRRGTEAQCLLGRLLRLAGRCVEHRGQTKVLPLLQHVHELGMDVAPLAQAHIAKEVIVTETAEPRLREALELVVKRVPDRQEGEEVGVRVTKPLVRRIRLRLLVERTLARILN